MRKCVCRRPQPADACAGGCGCVGLNVPSVHLRRHRVADGLHQDRPHVHRHGRKMRQGAGQGAWAEFERARKKPSGHLHRRHDGTAGHGAGPVSAEEEVVRGGLSAQGASDPPISTIRRASVSRRAVEKRCTTTAMGGGGVEGLHGLEGIRTVTSSCHLHAAAVSEAHKELGQGLGS